MAQCIDCKKKGLFLKLDHNGRCFECAGKHRALEREQIHLQKMKEKEEAQRKEEEARILSEKLELERINKTVWNTHSYILQMDDWYLTYTYQKVSIDLIIDGYFHGDVDLKSDKDDVLVIFENSIVGKVSNPKTKEMILDFLNRGEKVLAQFDSQKSLSVAFYQQLLKKLQGKNSLTFKIVNTSKKDYDDTPRYENLVFVKDGDRLVLEYDCLKEIYIVKDELSSELGELSKSASSIVLDRLNYGRNYFAFATDCDMDIDKDLRPIAKVKIYFT